MKKEKAFYQDNPYLDYWKKEIDDESINKEVLQKLLSYKKKYKQILDLGTGSGTQIRRNIELGLLANNGTIIGIDVNKEGLINSLSSFQKWAKQHSYKLQKLKNKLAIHKFTLTKRNEKFTIALYSDSVYDLGTIKTIHLGENYELVTALSLIEHTDMKKCLKSINKIMKKNGLLYAPINYDQHSVFGPTSEKEQEKEINLMQMFNYVAIDYQFKGNVDVGNSKCGSLLPEICNSCGFKTLAYGSSDWVIAAGNIIPYTNNKKQVLKFFINAFYNVLKNADETIKSQFNLSDEDIENWYKKRLNQLNSGELYYSCMQKDILCIKVQQKKHNL